MEKEITAAWVAGPVQMTDGSTTWDVLVNDHESMAVCDTEADAKHVVEALKWIHLIF